MNTCIKCGSDMIADLDLTVDVSTTSFSMTGGDASFGGGAGQIALTRKTNNRGLFSRKTESLGFIKASLCPKCGEVPLYLNANR